MTTTSKRRPLSATLGKTSQIASRPISWQRATDCGFTSRPTVRQPRERATAENVPGPQPRSRSVPGSRKRSMSANRCANDSSSWRAVRT